MMDALSPPDALTLERALAAPLPAIAYQLGRVIEEHARGRAVLEVDDGGFDLEVIDQIPIMPPINEHNARYLATKRDKLGHRLPKD